MQYKIYQEGHDCRDFILYLCPVGELQAQLSLFWQKSKVMRRNDLRFTIYDDKNNTMTAMIIVDENCYNQSSNKRVRMMQKIAMSMTMRTVMTLTIMTMFRMIPRMVTHNW